MTPVSTKILATPYKAIGIHILLIPVADVAVAGLPERNPNHAVVMARFAVHCLQEITSLMKKLELVLGPGTAALTIRVGLHVSCPDSRSYCFRC